jgi:uracil-DNA glycosylase family 4
MLKDCKDCDLHKTRTNIVPGAGPRACKVMVIGEAPGEEEDLTGAPFMGRAGRALDKLLEDAGLEDVYITNAVKCRPPGNRDPSKDEKKACFKWLAEEIRRVSPEYIILLGRAPISVFFKKASLDKEHGTVREVGKYKFFLSYHPAAAFYNSRPRKALPTDFMGLGKMVRATDAQVPDYPNIISLDTEVEDGEMFCVAAAGYGVRDPWGKIVDVSDIRKLSKLKSLTFIFHHAKFDQKVLLKAGVDVRRVPYEDTSLLAHHLGFPLGLKELSLYVNGRPLRTLTSILRSGKKPLQMEDRRAEVEQYCIEDAEATRDVYVRLEPTLTPSMRKLYRELDLPLSSVLREMEIVGMGVDVKALERLGKELEEVRERYTVVLREYGLSTGNRTNALVKVLFEDMDLPVIKRTDTGSPAADEYCLKELEEYAPDLIGAILKWREVHKLKSTYVDAWLRDRDANDRIHPSYNQVGTITGRLSSSKPNVLNIPVTREWNLKKCIVPSPGYVFLYADAAQIEWKAAAVLSGDENMLAICNSGTDVHMAVALDLLHNKDHRRIAKTLNFAMLYGGSEDTIVEKYFEETSIRLPLEEARRYKQQYFERYPRLLEWIREQHEGVLREGAVYGYFGRKLYVRDITSDNYKDRQGALRQAVNYPVQNTAADAVKKVMVDLAPILEKEGGRLISQVYDSITAEVPVDSWLADAERASKLLTEILSSHLDRVTFPMEAVIGYNLDFK